MVTHRQLLMAVDDGRATGEQLPNGSIRVSFDSFGETQIMVVGAAAVEAFQRDKVIQLSTDEVLTAVQSGRAELVAVADGFTVSGTVLGLPYTAHLSQSDIDAFNEAQQSEIAAMEEAIAEANNQAAYFMSRHAEISKASAIIAPTVAANPRPRPRPRPRSS